MISKEPIRLPGRSDYHVVKVLTTVVSSLCLLTVAATLGMGHLYMMAIALAAVPLVSYVVGKRMLSGLSVQREVDEVVWDGQPVSVKLHVSNPSGLPRYFVQAQDTLPEGTRFCENEGIVPLSVPAKGSHHTTYSVTFQRRGEYLLGPLKLYAWDPLGMFFFSHQLPSHSSVLVLPSPLPLSDVELSLGSLNTAAGMHTAPLRGDSVEFFGIREYVRGDPLRRVDWKHSARHNQLYVRDFERFTQTEVCILLDRSAELRRLPNSFEMMIKAASGALHLAYRKGLPFRMLVGDPEVDNRRASCSSEQLYAYLHALAKVQPQPQTSWVELVARYAAEVLPGTLLVLISASDDERLLPILNACARRLSQVVMLLPNVPALDKNSRFVGALHRQDFLSALASFGAAIVPLHPLEETDGQPSASS